MVFESKVKSIGEIWGSGGRKSKQTLGYVSHSVGNVKWVPCDLYFGGGSSLPLTKNLIFPL